ncbi:hypothetical protein D0T84_06675 [Dysgonomonas sp. 521]|nr:hypothetical protein [Dysgonomonas sp. 521]
MCGGQNKSNLKGLIIKYFDKISTGSKQAQKMEKKWKKYKNRTQIEAKCFKTTDILIEIIK